ncbi:outer membrane beta-barrel protein [Flexithrix dorotheae]|uniref:outer membrane beta-barrel protein n=1 Tax=Flexithrix dorotheae TaxID=70993 RepID=UPI00035F39D7|nr:outer membrane beta-barrel protein [Flexithrix dorotheae]
MYKKLLIAFIFLFSITFYQASAQAKWSISGGLGASGYIGDLGNTGINTIRPAANFETWYHFNNVVQIKAGASIYQLYAEDHVMSRNRDFRANLWDAYAGLNFTVPTKTVQPFTYVGLGVTKVDPEGKTPNGYTNLYKMEPEAMAMPEYALILPVGFGLRFLATPQIAIVLDGSLRITDTDQLDAVSRKSIPVNDLSAEAISYHNSIRSKPIAPDFESPQFIAGGNPDADDLYWMFTVKFQYIIWNKGFYMDNPVKVKRRRSNKRYKFRY